MKTSVALCTYNGEKFLSQQIDSILSQSIQVDEIIVCDDGSQDKTVSILKNYQEKHPDLFKIFINDKNLRSVKNFEKAISLCNNELIFLCDQDDIWILEKVEIFLNYFEKNSNISVIASNGFAIDDEGKTLDVITIWDVIGFLRERKTELNYYEILNFTGNIATGASMAIKKEFLAKAFPFPIISEFHHDEWIALISSLENEFDFIDDKTFFYRKHDQQQVGGVFYENTERRKTSLIDFFTPDFTDKSFRNYKFLLKRVGNAYQKNKYLCKSTAVRKEIFEKNMAFFRNLFYKLKSEMREKYPFQYYILMEIDKITKKRKID